MIKRQINEPCTQWLLFLIYIHLLLFFFCGLMLRLIGCRNADITNNINPSTLSPGQTGQNTETCVFACVLIIHQPEHRVRNCVSRLGHFEIVQQAVGTNFLNCTNVPRDLTEDYIYYSVRLWPN